MAPSFSAPGSDPPGWQNNADTPLPPTGHHWLPGPGVGSCGREGGGASPSRPPPPLYVPGALDTALLTTVRTLDLSFSCLPSSFLPFLLPPFLLSTISGPHQGCGPRGINRPTDNRFCPAPGGRVMGGGWRTTFQNFHFQCCLWPRAHFAKGNVLENVCLKQTML